LGAGRHDAAAYMCGYCVELALKARVCRTLNWPDFPETRKEFEGYSSFRTHDLGVLLHLSGQEANIKQDAFVNWNAVAQWDPAVRYKAVGSTTQQDAAAMIGAADALLKVL
jgi:HEPN domain-containing protein